MTKTALDRESEEKDFFIKETHPMPPPVIPHFLGANIYRLLGGLPLSLEMPKEGRCLL